ncbi:hypothetical protein N7471_011967 [Penicillium samsonianum]|uniref:uncharacterized protein n=1 Tax=Penicillium samsonianum TaxID=1882272 RepID=UPI0025480885|nr:uncharacterized protein N7471_011967 [Penicillium samsonianum]KAJ6124650.1 hypothetical protein N7471_011967 [Penicillium samsonianum]
MPFSQFIKRLAEPVITYIRGFLLNTIRQGPIPKHVAFIMDGNRRYAREHDLPIVDGHKRGIESLMKMLDEGFECGIEVITIYAFSLENFHRPKEQVYDLMVLLKGFVSQFAPQSPLVKKFDLKLRVVGRVELLEEDFRKIVQETADRLKNNRGKILNVCLAYTARDEITTAISKTATSCVSTGEITAKALSDNMFIGSPAPDLLIRSSGVHRLSDFLLWQCHQNTVIEIVDVKWPEFGMRAMGLILLKWQRRRKSCILPEAQEKEKTPG